MTSVISNVVVPCYNMVFARLERIIGRTKESQGAAMAKNIWPLAKGLRNRDLNFNSRSNEYCIYAKSDQQPQIHGGQHVS